MPPQEQRHICTGIHVNTTNIPHTYTTITTHTLTGFFLILKKKKRQLKPNVVVNAYNLSIWEVETT